jgi:cytochrome b561
MSANGAISDSFAMRVFKVSRIIHWATVALVSGLAVAAWFGEIDPHGNGNSAFQWHSSLGYALLVALPISGWSLASEQGMPAHLFGMPALPQWYYREPAHQFAADRATEPHETRSNDNSVVIYLRRIHGTLAAALSIVVVIHVFTVIRVRARRRD